MPIGLDSNEENEKGVDKKEEIQDQMLKNKINGMVHELTDEDRKKIVELMM